MTSIGHEKAFNCGKFGKLRFRCIASRSTRARADMLKNRLTRIGTITIRIVKQTHKAVGVPPTYWIYARPAKSLTWEKLDAAVGRLL